MLYCSFFLQILLLLLENPISLIHLSPVNITVSSFVVIPLGTTSSSSTTTSTAAVIRRSGSSAARAGRRRGYFLSVARIPLPLPPFHQEQVLCTSNRNKVWTNQQSVCLIPNSSILSLSARRRRPPAAFNRTTSLLLFSSPSSSTPVGGGGAISLFSSATRRFYSSWWRSWEKENIISSTCSKSRIGRPRRCWMMSSNNINNSSADAGAEESVAAAMYYHQQACTADNNICSTTSSTNFASYLEAIPATLESHFIHDDEQENTTNSDVVFQIIMGNEAGDADSIVSALALSFVDHGAGGGGGYYYYNYATNDKVDEQESTVSTTVGDTPGKNSIVVPVPLVSIPRADFPLRRDVVLLLEMAGVNCEKLLFLRDDEMIQIMRAEQHHKRNVRNEWTLVDHNQFRKDLEMVGNVKVVEILDHHQDEGAHDMVEKGKRNIAFENQSALVGSTCTLVTERLMKRYFQKENHNHQIDAGLGLALLGVILLDTMNMSKEAAKGTARDEVAINFLLARTDWSALKVTKKEWKEALGFETNNDAGVAVPSRSRLYEFLQNCKFDVDFWTSMSPKDALRIDYKRFETKASEGGVGPVSFGLSSVLLDMPTLLSKPNFMTMALAYMNQVNVTLLGVLTMTIVNDKPKREMLLLGDKQRVQEMTDFLLHNDAAVSLKISKAEDDFHVELDNDTMAAVHLKQGNPKGSRKQVAPVMLAGMK
jgi:Inorganic pyrophosphatase/exopolyphosphatase